MQFHAKYIAHKLGIPDTSEAADVTQVCNELGRLPDTTYRGTEYHDGYAFEWIWLDRDNWSEGRVNARRFYSGRYC